MPTITKTDRSVIRGLATQDMAGKTDDSYARTFDARATIRSWATSAAQAGDHDLVSTIDRVGIDEAARLYEAARWVETAYLFWDCQDRTASGWVLRYRERGEEHTAEVHGGTDDNLETLAAAVVAAVPDLTSEVRVYRGDRQVGRIDLTDGEVTNWRAV